MAKSDNLTTISIDTRTSTFHFYTTADGNAASIEHHIKKYAGAHFSDEFYEKFKAALKDFVERHPAEGVQKVTLVLPDAAVLTDTVKIPTLRGPGQTKKSLEATLDGLYRNRKDLRIVSYMANQNRQNSTFALAAVQKDIVSKLYAAVSENKMLIDTLTFASNSAASAASLIDGKLKNASYLLLDVKNTYARFVFVANGKAVGFYTLPFGLEFLRKKRVVQEDMLFNHNYAELTVLNAKERAKSKKLTVMALAGDDAALLDEEDEDDTLEPTEPIAEETDDEAYEPDDEPIAPQPGMKLYFRKSPRRLPKFMLRDVPETQEGILYENFRVFVKWALTLIAGNDKLTELGKPAFVCVNLPDDLAGVLDAVNAEIAENGIKFVRLPVGDQPAQVADNLELYGGLFPKHYTANKF